MRGRKPETEDRAHNHRHKIDPYGGPWRGRGGCKHITGINIPIQNKYQWYCCICFISSRPMPFCATVNDDQMVCGAVLHA